MTTPSRIATQWATLLCLLCPAIAGGQARRLPPPVPINDAPSGQDAFEKETDLDYNFAPGTLARCIDYVVLATSMVPFSPGGQVIKKNCLTDAGLENNVRIATASTDAKLRNVPLAIVAGYATYHQWRRVFQKTDSLAQRTDLSAVGATDPLPERVVIMTRPSADAALNRLRAQAQESQFMPQIIGDKRNALLHAAANDLFRLAQLTNTRSAQVGDATVAAAQELEGRDTLNILELGGGEGRANNGVLYTGSAEVTASSSDSDLIGSVNSLGGRDPLARLANTGGVNGRLVNARAVRSRATSSSASRFVEVPLNTQPTIGECELSADLSRALPPVVAHYRAYTHTQGQLSQTAITNMRLQQGLSRASAVMNREMAMREALNGWLGFGSTLAR
jgi:hypothetical protein